MKESTTASRSAVDIRAMLERVRWEVMALLAASPKLTLADLYARVRETFGEDTDMVVARVISTLLRAHKIAMEPASDPDAGMSVALV